MPSYADLIANTMLYTAVRGHGRVSAVDASGGFSAPDPHVPLKDPKHVKSVTVIRDKPIWRFDWDPSKPSSFKKIKLCSRGMGMNYNMMASVYEKIDFEDPEVVRETGERVKLPLEKDYVVEASWLRTGKIPESSSGLWHLEARTDTSLLVAFAYQFVCGTLLPIPREEIDALGDAFMPDRTPELFRGIVEQDTEALVCIGPVRYLVIVELVTCKENNDFVPGGLIGMARIHPHMMVIGNEDLLSVESTIDMRRAKKAMTHGDPEMGTEHHALVVCDTNTANMPVPFAEFDKIKDRPIPYNDIIYDYFCEDPAVEFKDRDPAGAFDEPDHEYPDYPGDHPLQKTGEITMSDNRFPASRRIPKAVRRTSLKPIQPGPGFVPIIKFPRQGQFDNVHLAPRMKTTFATDKGDMTIDEIMMLFVCLHDCVHTHVRWGGFSGKTAEKIIRGWRNGLPFQEAGVPAVPENQVVFVKFPTAHSWRYRAVAQGVPMGKWQVFFHHGSAYAIDVWPEAEGDFGTVNVLRATIDSYAKQLDEPWKDEMGRTWPAFYWRLRWGGKYGERPVQRLSFDLTRCMR